MSSITGLEEKRNGIRVYLDGRFAFSLQKDIAVTEGLCIGQEISPAQAAALDMTGHLQRCLDSALRYLSYRPQSEAELRTKLMRRGFTSEVIRTTMEKLKEKGLVDDMVFADFWQQNRNSLSPRSQLLTRLELKKKGVSNQVIQALPTGDDMESAYLLASSRAQRYFGDDRGQRRLGDFLRRRGYSYEVVKSTVERIFKEHAIDSLQAGCGMTGDKK